MSINRKINMKKNLITHVSFLNKYLIKNGIPNAYFYIDKKTKIMKFNCHRENEIFKKNKEDEDLKISYLDNLNKMLINYEIYDRYFLIDKTTNDITINCRHKNDCHLLKNRIHLYEILNDNYHNSDKKTCDACNDKKIKKRVIKGWRHKFYIGLMLSIINAILVIKFDLVYFLVIYIITICFGFFELYYFIFLF